MGAGEHLPHARALQSVQWRLRHHLAVAELAGRGYFSLIGVPVFSAGAGGSAGCAPAFCASTSGRAGSGAGVVGRAPPGVDSAGTSFCASDVDEGAGCVAWASCVGGLPALISANDSAEWLHPRRSAPQPSANHVCQLVFAHRQTCRSPQICSRDQRSRGNMVPGEHEGHLDACRAKCAANATLPGCFCIRVTSRMIVTTNTAGQRVRVRARRSRTAPGSRRRTRSPYDWTRLAKRP